MIKTCAAVWTFVLVIAAGVSGSAWGQVSPFTRVEFEDDGRVMVTLDGERVEFVSIAGLPVDELVVISKREFRDLWQKRIGEDLLDVLEAAGIKLADESVVSLEVVGNDGARIIIDAAPMTRRNRQEVWGWNSVLRPDHLDDLVDVIEAHHAYATMKGLDLRDEAERLKAELGAEPSSDDVRLAMQRLVCMLGDGHASISAWREAAPSGRLPFLLASAEDGIVAMRWDRSGLLDPDRPFVASIDGVDIDDWIAAASVYVSAGSEQLIRSRSLRLMRYVNLVRQRLGIEPEPTMRVVLTDAGYADKNELVLELVRHRGIYGDWPRTFSRRLELKDAAQIGYLRIPSMMPLSGETDAEWQSALRAELERVTRDAEALIIDVRGNGGGGRQPIRALMPCLMQAGDVPVVVNAARYHFQPGEDPEASGVPLEDRFLFPESWPGWGEAERNAIASFKETFAPEWHAPKQGFSGWHYMVVSPGDDDLPRFEGPVVVLMDEGCFSATDIFLGALGELPNVTLLGTPSAGGSARGRTHRIGRVDVRLASMASYQPSGQLYDGVGVQPDVVVEKRPSDLVLGGTDAQLDAAIAMLREQID